MKNQQMHVAAPAADGLDLEVLLYETQKHILPTALAALAQHSLSRLYSTAVLLNKSSVKKRLIKVQSSFLLLARYVPNVA